MRFKNETNGAVKYYGFDDHGYKGWQVLSIGQEGNMPTGKGLGLKLTPLGNDKAFTPLAVKQIGAVKEDSMQLGEDGPIVPKIEIPRPKGKTTSDMNRSLKGKPVEKPKPIQEVVEETAEKLKDVIIPGHEAKKNGETAEVAKKTEEVKEDLASEVKKINGIGTATSKDIATLYTDKKEMVDALKDDKKHIPLRDDTVKLLKDKFLKEE